MFVIPNGIIKAGAIIVYTDGYTTPNGIYEPNHIHGVGIKTIKTDVLYIPRDEDIKTHSIKKEYRLFRLDNGEEFMEYERKDWEYLTGYWPESPQCCKDAFNKHKE